MRLSSHSQAMHPRQSSVRVLVAVLGILLWARMARAQQEAKATCAAVTLAAEAGLRRASLLVACRSSAHGVMMPR